MTGIPAHFCLADTFQELFFLSEIGTCWVELESVIFLSHTTPKMMDYSPVDARHLPRSFIVNDGMFEIIADEL